MLKIQEISFRNFRSYGKNTTKISFDSPGTTIIIGKSDDGGTTNGIGKTSVFFCLQWLLYDKVIDSVNKDELINNINKGDLWGEVILAAKEGTYTIQRWRKGGKTGRDNGVRILINGEDATPAGVDDANALIQDVIGVDFELFSRIVVFSATNKSFFDLPSNSAGDANQTNMIEQLFNLQVLTKKSIALKAKIKETDAELKLQEKLIDQATKQISTHAEVIVKTKQKADAWETNRVKSIEELRTSVDSVQTIDFEAEKKIHKQIETLTATRKELLAETKLLTSKKETLTLDASKLKKEKASLLTSTCPYCNQHFADSASKLEHVGAKLDSAEAMLKQLTTKLASVSDDVTMVNSKLTTARQKTTVEDFDALVELKAKHQELIIQLDQLQQQLNPHLETLHELEGLAPEQPDFNAVNQLMKLSDHQEFLLKLLTKKDSFVRKTLVQRNIPFLNERLGTYLQQMGLPHKVEFTANLLPVITQYGRETSFGCLSTGQKARVNFALSMAFGDALQAIHQKINIRLFDEVLDIGLDTHGILAASRILKRKAAEEGLAMYVISHRDEVQHTFDRSMVITQQDGFSMVRQ